MEKTSFAYSVAHEQSKSMSIASMFSLLNVSLQILQSNYDLIHLPRKLVFPKANVFSMDLKMDLWLSNNPSGF